MSLTQRLLSALALTVMAGSAHATYVPASWSDSVAGSSTPITTSSPYTYTHDLATDGFNVGHDLVTDFLLSIDLYDDQDRSWFEFETAFVDLPGLLGDRAVFSFGNNAYEGWSLTGLLELNLLGTLTVTIYSLTGDFVFGGSDLVANGFAHTTASVPEPATLGLLGLGLLGVAASRRRKAR